MACVTQWVVGVQGATGLNYTALESVMRMLYIPAEKQPDLFGKVRLIEAGVLKALADHQRAKEKAKRQTEPR